MWAFASMDFQEVCRSHFCAAAGFTAEEALQKRSKLRFVALVLKSFDSCLLTLFPSARSLSAMSGTFATGGFGDADTVGALEAQVPRSAPPTPAGPPTVGKFAELCAVPSNVALALTNAP